jgi:hypothetical protein
MEVGLGESYPCFGPPLQRIYFLFPQFCVAVLNITGGAVDIEAWFLTMS